MKSFRNLPMAFYGVLLIIISISLYMLGLFVGLFELFFLENTNFAFNNIIRNSGMPMLIGLFLIFFDIQFLLPKRIVDKKVRMDPINNKSLTVVLTAYNDEESIYHSVKDFKNNEYVKRVIVVSNNSSDKTEQNARRAGAIVVNETNQGYGHCVYRALKEGISYNDTVLTLLSEGDCTFVSNDIYKFLAYIPHVDIVIGTRTVDQLQGNKTQLTTLMHYGNIIVGKLLEIKNMGRATISDVGTTYKLCRNDSIRKNLSKLNPSINLEFNPHFLDIFIENSVEIVEIPVTFHRRKGLSKGGNINNVVAFKLALKMIKGIIFGWKK